MHIEITLLAVCVILCAAIAVCVPKLPEHRPYVSRRKPVVGAESTQLPGHTECSLVPKLFVAVTVKRYETPFVRPVTCPALLSSWQLPYVQPGTVEPATTT